MARPRGHHGSGDDDPSGSRRHGPAPEARSVAHGQEIAAEIARRGRPGNPSPPAGDPPRPLTPDDIELIRQQDVLEKLGSEPPKVNVARNDVEFDDEGAHTLDRHGPDIPLPRDPSAKTIEGRIFGDAPWRRENASFKWTDHTTMNRTINEYISQNWEAIRNDLAVTGNHQGLFDAGHRVGVGYFNKGMFGAGPREAQFWSTSLVKIRMSIVDGSDPPQPFLVTAFPAALG